MCLTVTDVDCTEGEEEESGTHLHAAHQRVGQILQKIIIYWIRSIPNCNLLTRSVLNMVATCIVVLLESNAGNLCYSNIDHHL